MTNHNRLPLLSKDVSSIINSSLNVHKILDVTEVEGPGKRFCIWVQGCSVRCKGCAVPWTWNPTQGTKMSVSSLIERVKQSIQENGITGVTILGGEPFDQADALAPFLEAVQNLNLNVLAFSGYYYEQLLQRGVNPEIFDYIDLLIEGPFDQQHLDLSRPWVGSSNQKYRFLSDLWDESMLTMYSNKVEVRVNADGTIDINGMIDAESLLELQKQIQAFKK